MIQFVGVMVEYFTAFFLVVVLAILSFMFAKEKQKYSRCVWAGFIVILVLLLITSFINLFAYFLTSDVWQGVIIVERLGDFSLILASFIVIGFSVFSHQIEGFF